MYCTSYKLMVKKLYIHIYVWDVQVQVHVNFSPYNIFASPIFYTQNIIGYFFIFILSWILLCLWIGICYTTVYTSLLTSPGFTKIIDTIEDFLEKGETPNYLYYYFVIKLHLLRYALWRTPSLQSCRSLFKLIIKSILSTITKTMQSF